MPEFVLHDKDSAPTDSKTLLEKSQSEFGFLPNFMRAASDSPEALKAYSSLDELFSHTTLNDTERQVVLLAASAENNCEFCMHAHSKHIKKNPDMDDTIAERLLSEQELSDKKLEALNGFTREVIRKRGDVDQEILQHFFIQGYTPKQALEVILGITMKTLSNYINHVAEVPLNDELKDAA